MERYRGFVGVVLLFGCSPPWIQGKFISEDFGRESIALFKVIDYIHSRPHQMNVDATFGITIAEANIAATLLHENTQYLGNKYLNILRTTLRLCDLTRRVLINNVVPDSAGIELLHETLNNPALWIRRIYWKNGTLRDKQNSTSQLTHQNVFDLIMQGAPKEEESDRCLVDIVRSKLGATCDLPETCITILSSKNRSRGYPLTHKLLIIEVIIAVRNLYCPDKIRVRFSNLIFFYCSAILKDLIDIKTAGFPFNTRDLMMEQVLLCGMEGFLEFVGKNNQDLILSWQHPSGCFSSFGFHTQGIPLARRNSLKTDFGCDSHATGLSAAALSMFIRESVENAF